MTRIEQLEQYGMPEDFAYKDRSFPKLACCIKYEFERQGGARVLKYAEWNINVIDSLTEEEFKEIIDFLEAYSKLDEAYSGLSLIDYLTKFTPTIEIEV